MIRDQFDWVGRAFICGVWRCGKCGYTVAGEDHGGLSAPPKKCPICALRAAVANLDERTGGMA